jgi:hypothetical protein
MSNVRRHESPLSMSKASPNTKSVSAASAAVLGLLLVVAAFVLSEFFTFPATGHRVNTDAWPPEARSILKENPGVPITSEQWKRIDKALRPYGGAGYGQVPYWSQTVRASWWWFAVLPVAALGLMIVRRLRIAAATAVLVAAPSVVVLLAGVSLSGAGK